MSIQVNLKTISRYTGCLLTLASTGFVNAEETKPNVVLILIDDSGWSDLGCYGSEIHTPAIDSLANNGIRYRRFYNAARSSPTRCAILTGLYTQQVAVDPSASLPNLRNDNNVTIAELLKSNGYRTYMSGKWHLGAPATQRDPLNRGFQHVFGFGANVSGSNVGSYWNKGEYALKSENNEITWDTYEGKQFHQTDAIGDYSVKFINHHLGKNDQKPFFLYMAFNAGHWPINAPAALANKYTDVADENNIDEDYYNYEVGWDSTRMYRFKRQKELGVIDESYELSPRSDAINPANTQIPAWDTLDEKRKNDLARRMALYAAMIQQIDENVKKVVDLLKATDQLDNTIIMFVSDNGGNYENYVFGNPNARESEDLYTMGQPDDPSSFPRVDIGGGWANVCNTPFRLYKHFVHEGGIRSPGIIFYPAGITKPGTWVEQPAHLIDLMATIVDVSGVTYPETYNSHVVLPLEGQSLKPHFTGGLIPERQIFVEHESNRALYDGDYKFVTKNFAMSDGSSPAHQLELYNMKNDPCELSNLASSEPNKLASMVEDWNLKAQQVGVPAARLLNLLPDFTPELKFRFTFDDKLTDESPNAYELTPGQDAIALYDEGKYGSALSLNGTSDYFDLNVNNIVDPASQAVTACAWVYNTQPGGSWQLTSNGYDEEQVLHQLGGRVVLHHVINNTESNIGSWMGGAQYKSTVNNCFSVGEWQHIAVVSNPVAMTNTFFRNGEQLGDPVNVTTTFTSSTGGFRIGAHKNLGSFWHGKLDEVSLFKGVLTAEQITQVMNNNYDISSAVPVVGEPLKLRVYPNPTQGVLFIEGNDIKQLDLMTLDSRIIYSTGQTSYVDLSALPCGNYLLRVQRNGGETEYRKIVLIN